MFTYINENFLHAPSFDLSRDTVKSLIQISLAQAQEIFLEKQVAAKTKDSLLARLASQTGHLYSQALEGVQENVAKAMFEKVWATMVQIKTSHFNSVAQYYQAMTDAEAGQHGVALGRLIAAENLSKEAEKLARNFPSSVPPSSNLNPECGAQLQEMCKRQLSTVQDKHKEALKDNDFIYHQTVPPEASLPAISKAPAAKPIPVSELYAGQDIQRITGPDLFAKIVPMAVTESASMYDEEKAKLIRAETERVETANDEMATSLDYLRLPGALQVLKGGFDQDILPDEDFRQWCDDVADHEDPATIFDFLRSEKDSVVSTLAESSKQLDLEESSCEKMRSRFENDWTQQPSSGLTTTLRSDIRSYREALDEAMRTDNQLRSKLAQNERELGEMRRASQQSTVDQLFQSAVTQARANISSGASPATAEPSLLDADFGESGPSVVDQIAVIEDLLKKLNAIKRERNQILKDLKEKVHTDDISQVLILNKKAIASQESQFFQEELQKFKPHQTRLLQANQKQSSLLKELSATFNSLLQDKRVRSEQSKYETIQRQRSTAINRYKRAYQEFLDLEAGLQSAKVWYAEMRETVGSLKKNVDSFVNNRRAEGLQIMDSVDRKREANKSQQAELEQERLRGLMDRMNVGGTSSSSSRQAPAPLFQPGQAPRYGQTSYQSQQMPTSPPPHQQSYSGYSSPPPASTFYQTYNPSTYGPTPGPTSPPPNQTSFGMSAMRNPASPPPTQTSFAQSYQGYNAYNTSHTQHQPQQHQPPMQSQPGFAPPPGFVPPPPPPGPPPLGPQQTVHYPPQTGYNGPGQGPQGSSQHDPWAGLSNWK